MRFAGKDSAGEDGKAEEVGVVAGVIGLVVGVDGDEVDADLVWDFCDQVWLQEVLPDVAILPLPDISGALLVRAVRPAI